MRRKAHKKEQRGKKVPFCGKKTTGGRVSWKEWRKWIL